MQPRSSQPQLVAEPARCSGLLRCCCRLLALLLAAIALPAAEPLGTPSSCLLLTREGRVEFAPRGTRQWQRAQTNQVLQAGDQLRTGLRSRATLRWSDLSTLRVDELTTMVIQPPQQPRTLPQLELRSGASYFFSREPPSEIQFRTPTASGAIRGTEFNLAVEPDGRTILSLLDGQVDLVTDQGQATLQPGQQGVVAPGQAPATTALLDAINVIQWVLYYPAVIDPDELGLSTAEEQAFGESLAAYRAGDVLAALAAFPEAPRFETDSGRLWQAALLLAAGQVDQTEAALRSLEESSPLSGALGELIAAVQGRTGQELEPPATASGWLARSYYQQARRELGPALQSARHAVGQSPRFGAAWVRVAELEFGFGHVPEASAALARGLELCPRHAQGLALQGYLLAARGHTGQALSSFEQAIAMDGALGSAWLGRGLARIRLGWPREGLQDLQVAATLEPQRSLLRSYLGKAFSHLGDPARARKELELARTLDPEDPTPWLYLALLNQRQNRINGAARDLQQSKELNDNRSLFRSRLLLDQDQAVRGANLASIYRDLGMPEFSAREASRAVNYDYANYSAHLFLANSYDALRDPKLFNLRYETPWFSELLVAQLLAPVGASSLSQNISQQEYSRFFDVNHLGLFSSTDYYSSGDWVQRGSHYGIIDHTSYSLDAFYRTENGQRPNNDLEQLELSARIKQEITPQDSLFFQAWYFDSESGDISQYYSQAEASPTLRVKEEQSPNLLAGYHRQWSPGSHTLFLAGRFDDTLDLDDSSTSVWWHRTRPAGSTLVNPTNNYNFSLGYRSQLEAYSAEIQHIWQTPAQTLIVGGRYQAGWLDAASDLQGQPRTPLGLTLDFPTVSDASLSRVSIYAYENWQVLEPLRLTVGLSYDHLRYPENIEPPLVSEAQETDGQVSPKLGFLYQPWPDTHLRGAYTRSLGGVFFDTSVRLEPTQIAGFNQAYRSLIPESVAGLIPGSSFETFSLGLDQAIRKTGTYLVIEGERLLSEGTRTVGLLENSDPLIAVPDTASATRRDLDFEERSLIVTVHQMLGPSLMAGLRYRLTGAELDSRLKDLPPSVTSDPRLNGQVEATLHQLWLYAIYQHQCGFFAEASTVWSQQSNRQYVPDIPGDDFWQYNLRLGYRLFQRRVEASVALLNIGDRDYQLNPLTLYRELPRERTFAASLKWYF